MLKAARARSQRWKNHRATPSVGSGCGHRPTWSTHISPAPAPTTASAERNPSAASAPERASRVTKRARASGSSLAARRLGPGCPETSADRSVTAAKAPTGPASGHAVPRRYSRSRSRQPQRSTSRASEVSDSVMEKPSPTTKAPSRPRRRVVTSIRVPLEEDPGHGERDNLEVQPERPALDALEVVLDALLERGVAPEPRRRHVRADEPAARRHILTAHRSRPARRSPGRGPRRPGSAAR